MTVEVQVRHRITEADPSTRTGVCSVCGPVGIHKGSEYKGTLYWRCGAYGKDYARDRYLGDPTVEERLRETRFLRLYGITIEEYEALLTGQGGVCARCQEPPTTMRLAVDHCHETGRVRGLLCGPCNTYLGRLEASLARLADDLAYIGTPDAQVISERLADTPVKGW